MNDVFTCYTEASCFRELLWKNDFLKCSLRQHFWMSSDSVVFHGEGWDGSSMMESSLCSDLLVLTDSSGCRFGLMIVLALWMNLLILLTSLTLMPLHQQTRALQMALTSTDWYISRILQHRIVYTSVFSRLRLTHDWLCNFSTMMLISNHLLSGSKYFCFFFKVELWY